MNKIRNHISRLEFYAYSETVKSGIYDMFDENLDNALKFNLETFVDLLRDKYNGIQQGPSPDKNDKI